jgi:hypothetical protein
MPFCFSAVFFRWKAKKQKVEKIVKNKIGFLNVEKQAYEKNELKAENFSPKTVFQTFGM